MCNAEQNADAAAATAAVLANEEGYDACYDGFKKRQCPYPEASDAFGDWMKGWNTAAREIDSECDGDDREDFDSGRWSDDDTRSMEAGRDLPMRNEAGEWM